MTDTLHPDHHPDPVHCVQVADGLVVRLIGDIDMSSWARLDEAYDTIHAAEPCPVTVDLSAATFIDSTTLGFLARLHELVKGRGHELVLESPSRIVARAMEVSGLNRVLTVRP
jgi:anti-sigma B factor antagonist